MAPRTLTKNLPNIDVSAWINLTPPPVINDISFTSFSFSFDKGRRCGVDWLRGSALAFETKSHSVLSPVAISGFYFGVSLTSKNPCFSSPCPAPAAPKKSVNKNCQFLIGFWVLRTLSLPSKNFVWSSKKFGPDLYRSTAASSKKFPLEYPSRHLAVFSHSQWLLIT